MNDVDPARMHPIQVVSRRTGLSPDVLRAWERRYGAVRPVRSSGSRRLYTEDDILRLDLLRRAIDAGRSIGQVARLSTAKLKRLVETDEASTRRVPERKAPTATGRGPDPADHLEACLRAVGDLDAASLEAAIGRASIAMGSIALIDRVLIPLMHHIGSRWEHGSLRIVHEHVASAVVRTFLGNLALSRNPPTAPLLVGATPIGQHHEFGALTSLATAVTCGWNTAWLGGALPSSEIAAAVQSRRARAVALGLTFPDGDPSLARDLVALRRHVGDTPILVGGSAAVSYRSTLQEIEAHVLEGMSDLRRALRDLAARRDPRVTDETGGEAPRVRRST